MKDHENDAADGSRDGLGCLEMVEVVQAARCVTLDTIFTLRGTEE